MSVNAVDWALRFAPVDARHNGAARVLMCLANVADDEGRNAHPTHRKLAAWCKCSVSTVKPSGARPRLLRLERHRLDPRRTAFHGKQGEGKPRLTCGPWLCRRGHGKTPAHG